LLLDELDDFWAKFSIGGYCPKCEWG